MPALERLTRDCTTIIISHDVHGLTCERVVWLEDGRIVDDGHPASVMARRGGHPCPAVTLDDQPRSSTTPPCAAATSCSTPPALEEWLSRALAAPCRVVPRRLRYKPGTSAVLAFDLTREVMV